MKRQRYKPQVSERWRVGHIGRDGMYYEELRDGRWRRLRLDGELLMGRAHHVIYFGDCVDWKKGPAWAQGRRDEIVDRIKSAFRIRDYEYDGEAVLSESDGRRLVEAAGGLGDKPCKWAGCARQTLQEERKRLRQLRQRDDQQYEDWLRKSAK